MFRIVARRRWLIPALAAISIALPAIAYPDAPAAHAKGPNLIAVAVELADGGTVPGAGAPVASTVRLQIDASGTPPGEAGFFDLLRTSSSGIVPSRGPGHPYGSAQPPGAMGARAGDAMISVRTNYVIGLSANTATSGAYAGVVPACGDNDPTVMTRDYTNTSNPVINQQLIATNSFDIHVGSMTASSFRPTLLFADSDPSAPNWQPAEYWPGGPLVQTFDDDNNNGTVDWMEGGVAEPPADSSSTYPHPWATGAGGGAYVAGTPETQHDDDGDGLPDGLEAMPDILGVLTDALGLSSAWVSRGYGTMDLFPGLAAPEDVHVLGFDLAFIGSSGGATFMVRGNYLAPPDPRNQALESCAPLTLTVHSRATTDVVQLCKFASCGAPPGVTPGDAVQTIMSSGAHSWQVMVSDQDDYDQDSRVGPADLCTRSLDNTDPDGDLISGVCDPAPASDDNDGDGLIAGDLAPSPADLIGNPGSAPCENNMNGVCDNDVDDDDWINNVDNCETVSNRDQRDDDQDGVGDACDAFLTIDNFSGLPAGKGNTTNLPSLIDNDVICTDAWLPFQTEVFGDESCIAAVDSNDDGVPDGQDFDSDEDGDGVADGQEVVDGTNPLDPFDGPAIGGPGGPVFLSGDDADDIGHCQATACGGLYPQVLSALVSGSDSPGSGILAVGLVPGSTAHDGLTSWNNPVNGGPGASITIVGGSAISTVNFLDYDMLYIPSDAFNTFGGISDADLGLLAARKNAISTFVNASGGALMALTEGDASASVRYAWLPFTLVTQTVFDTNVAPTSLMAAQYPGVTTSQANMSHCCYHNGWIGPPGLVGLNVLAVDLDTLDGNGDPLPVILGGDPVVLGCGTGSDTDSDGLSDSQEIALGTNPCQVDTDVDGCSDSEELGGDPQFGGLRDPLNHFDFYDVSPVDPNNDRFVDLGDTLLVLAHFGHGPADDALDQELDRNTPNLAEPWASGESDDGLDLIDALANLRQFGSDCGAPPN